MVKRFIIPVVILIALASLGTQCHPDSQDLILEPGEHLKILLIGDSNTTGATVQLSFANVLNLVNSPIDFDVTNISCPGSSIRDWVSTPAITACNSDPNMTLFSQRYPQGQQFHVAHIMLGSADALGVLEENTTSDAEYGIALTILVTNLYNLGVERIILTTPPPHASDDVEIDAILQGYSEVVTDYCESSETDIVVCGPDVNYLMSLDEELYFDEDPTHFNQAGHNLISNYLLPLITNLVTVPE